MERKVTLGGMCTRCKHREHHVPPINSLVQYCGVPLDDGVAVAVDVIEAVGVAVAEGGQSGGSTTPRKCSPVVGVAMRVVACNTES